MRAHLEEVADRLRSELREHQRLTSRALDAADARTDAALRSAAEDTAIAAGELLEVRACRVRCTASSMHAGKPLRACEACTCTSVYCCPFPVVGVASLNSC